MSVARIAPFRTFGTHRIVSFTDLAPLRARRVLTKGQVAGSGSEGAGRCIALLGCMAMLMRASGTHLCEAALVTSGVNTARSRIGRGVLRHLAGETAESWVAPSKIPGVSSYSRNPCHFLLPLVFGELKGTLGSKLYSSPLSMFTCCIASAALSCSHQRFPGYHSFGTLTREPDTPNTPMLSGLPGHSRIFLHCVIQLTTT